MRDQNFYELLQVSENADQEIIQAAYRRLVLRYHPDRSSEPNAAEMTQRLNDAYAILSDPVRRAEYDRERRGSTGRPSSGTGRSRPNPPPPPRPPPPRPPHAEGNADSNDRFSGNVKWVAFALAGFVAVMVVVGVVVDNSGSGSGNERGTRVSSGASYRASTSVPQKTYRVSPSQPTAAPYVTPTPRARKPYVAPTVWWTTPTPYLVPTPEPVSQEEGEIVDPPLKSGRRTSHLPPTAAPAGTVTPTPTLTPVALAGTSWMIFQCRSGVRARMCHYDERSMSWQFDFLSNGEVRCSTSCASMSRTWEQLGTTIVIYVDTDRRTYLGTISRDRIYGTGSERNSAFSSGFEEWDWTATRLK